MLEDKSPYAVGTLRYTAAGLAIVVFWLLFGEFAIAFRDRSPISVQQLSRFGAVAVATAMWMALAMKIVSVELGVPYVVAKLICAVIVFVAWTYPAQRRLVFARPSTAPTWRVDVDADADVSAA